jgi:hypothetical protein
VVKIKAEIEAENCALWEYFDLTGRIITELWIQLRNEERHDAGQQKAVLESKEDRAG